VPPTVRRAAIGHRAGRRVVVMGPAAALDAARLLAICVRMPRMRLLGTTRGAERRSSRAGIGVTPGKGRVIERLSAGSNEEETGRRKGAKTQAVVPEKRPPRRDVGELPPRRSRRR